MNVLEWFLGAQTLPAGAIDVIAVRRDDGSLLCSPFHIKLGKASKKGEKKMVKIRVNGKEVEVFMKLGQAGEAFFVERTKEMRPREGLLSLPAYSADDLLLTEVTSPAFPLSQQEDVHDHDLHTTARIQEQVGNAEEEPMYLLEELDRLPNL